MENEVKINQIHYYFKVILYTKHFKNVFGYFMKHLPEKIKSPFSNKKP